MIGRLTVLWECVRASTKDYGWLMARARIPIGPIVLMERSVSSEGCPTDGSV